MFRDLLVPVARHRRAVALDWRGHGASEQAQGDYHTEDLVQDVLEVIDHAELGTVVPVALSHAGWVAIELRRQLGTEQIPGIVLLDWMVLGAPAPFADALAGLQDPQRWQDVREQLFARWTTGVDLPALDAHIAAMRAYGFDTWSRAGREIARRFGTEGSPVAALERLDHPCPTLHLYAQPSDEDYLAAQQAYAADRPWFHVQRLIARSHFPMLEVPTELVGHIERFLFSISGASRC